MMNLKGFLKPSSYIFWSAGLLPSKKIQDVLEVFEANSG